VQKISTLLQKFTHSAKGKGRNHQVRNALQNFLSLHRIVI
jgi:hypothetical protein